MLPGGLLGPSGYLLGHLGGFWEAIPRLRLTFAFDALLGAVVAFWPSFGVAFGTDFFNIYRGVSFRLQMLSSGLSWLSGLCLETQAFDLKPAVVTQTVS